MGRKFTLERDYYDEGFVLYYTNQCPFTAKYVPIIENLAKEHNIMFKSVFRLTACMKWFPPMANPSPSPLICHTVVSGDAIFKPVATAAARP